MIEYLLSNWLEVLGFLSGLLCVVLLIRENYLTFPIGLAYAVITIIVVWRLQLYADVVLNAYYVGMNAYGWYFWRYGGVERRAAGDLQVARMTSRALFGSGAVIIAGSLAMGFGFATWSDAALPYPDSFTTVASFVAMWMSARKYLESWVLWFVVDVVQIVLYLVKGVELYAALYGIYLIMAVLGWRAWQRSVEMNTKGQHDAGQAVIGER